MRFKLLRFDDSVQIGPDAVATIQIENRTVFARTVSSLMSEQGEYAVEPYAAWDDDGKRMGSRGLFLKLSSLPDVPLNDRALLGKLYSKIGSRIADDPDLNAEILDAANELAGDFLSLNAELWGTYDFDVDIDAAQILKAFAFKPDLGGEQPLLDRMISFFGLCADIGFEKPILMINAKSFFCPEDLDELASQAFFHGISLVLLESWHDEIAHPWERKMRIDRWLLEN